MEVIKVLVEVNLLNSWINHTSSPLKMQQLFECFWLAQEGARGAFQGGMLFVLPG